MITDARCGGKMQKRNRMILALDVTSNAEALKVANAARNYVDAIKINWPLILAAGPDIIREVSKLKDVICDFKIADIPNTNRLIVEQALARGASGVICHAFAGEDSVRACVEAAKGADVFVVTELSHPGGQEFTAKHAEEFARLAVRAGATGIIAPATRPERVRLLRGLVGDRLILAPGVGAQGGRPADAIRAGADAVIVGRSLYEAPDPAAAAAAIAREIESR